MARIEDIPQPTRDAILALEIAAPETAPFVRGGRLAERRIAIISSAALHGADEPPFMPGSAEYRSLPSTRPSGDLRMSHVSINFDRAGFQRDVNIVYPLERLRELAAEGVIGSVADTHYAVMGSTDPKTMTETAAAVSTRLAGEGVDGVLFLPV